MIATKGEEYTCFTPAIFEKGVVTIETEINFYRGCGAKVPTIEAFGVSVGDPPKEPFL